MSIIFAMSFTSVNKQLHFQAIPHKERAQITQSDLLSYHPDLPQEYYRIFRILKYAETEMGDMAENDSKMLTKPIGGLCAVLP
ncbi:hypothetical protein [Ruminococcus sp. NK3A76]|uniref:hypothetical protein n=1 Tax=Ruminococcus sp. NK3A76 TaxID=877411 RepID=UPI0004907C60|nr:hypothetical protein [Ruminococcus sp. NK3A76]